MILKIAGDGHYYIVGPPYPGAGIVAYQVDQTSGVEELRNRGIEPGNRVRLDVLNWLKERSLVWTGGSGPGDPGNPSLSRIPDGIVNALKEWGRVGNPEELSKVFLQFAPKLGVADCFPGPFCEWVIEQESSIGADTIPELSFHDVDANLLSQNLRGSALHARLLEDRDGCRVLYHWMKWTVEVHRIKAKGDPCPTVWHGKVHGILYNLLDIKPNTSPPSAQYWKKPHPFIRWAVIENLVEIVLPQQNSPSGASISCEVNGSNIPLVSRTEGGRKIWHESTFSVYDPETKLEYICYCVLGDKPLSPVSITFPRSDILLWDKAGRFIEPTEGIFPTSERDFYYLLARESQEEMIRSLGVDLEPGESLIEPVGWGGWIAYRVSFPQSLERLGPYWLVSSGSTLAVTLSDPPVLEIEAANDVPVYFEKWPTISVSPCELNTQVFMIVNDNAVLLGPISSNGRITLTGNHQLADIYGNIMIKADSFSPRGCHSVTTQFIRLPAWTLKYTQDPQEPNAKALRISGLTEKCRIVGLEDCTIRRDSTKECLVYASNPFKNPVASIEWNSPKSRPVNFRVRLPVNRGAFVSAESRIPNWDEIPIKMTTEHLLSKSGYIHLELASNVLLEKDGACFVKPPVGPACWVGKSMGRSVRLPIHRLRDFFGTYVESFSIRTVDDWVCFLEIDLPSAVTAEPLERIWDLSSALWDSNVDLLKEHWQKCLDSFSVESEEHEDWYSLFLGTLLSDWAGTEALLNKIDIPEVAYIRARGRLRRPATRESLDQVRHEVESWPQCSAKGFAEGERWYRFSRSQRYASEGALRSCYYFLNRLLAPDPVTRFESFCIASMSSILINGFGSAVRMRMPEPPQPNSHVHLYLSSIHGYLTNPIPRDYHSAFISFPESVTGCLASEDIAFLRTCSAQMQRYTTDSRNSLEFLRPNRFLFPTLFDLLMARQYRMEGDEKKALVFYEKVDQLSFVLDEKYY